MGPSPPARPKNGMLVSEKTGVALPANHALLGKGAANTSVARAASRPKVGNAKLFIFMIEVLQSVADPNPSPDSAVSIFNGELRLCETTRATLMLP